MRSCSGQHTRGRRGRIIGVCWVTHGREDAKYTEVAKSEPEREEGDMKGRRNAPIRRGCEHGWLQGRYWEKTEITQGGQGAKVAGA
ncbi:hypothetical protein GOP47_0002497 [Adiantum capillus-veneris]|uniref:Uncharacterized protein n=1 Tax=Adiantum capillus-veneris TaxID=13818 RepID=A0A9D4VAG7_ADICA|nr:hypothetical protein GOP47_0002497 [Adiantum capillus-veneris]